MKVPLAPKTLVNEPDKNGETTAVVYELTKRTQEVLFRFGTIIQSIFSAQSEVNMCLTVWKWSGESQYPGVLLPVLEFFRRAFSPPLTDCLPLGLQGWHGSYKTMQPFFKDFSRTTLF